MGPSTWLALNATSEKALFAADLVPVTARLGSMRAASPMKHVLPLSCRVLHLVVHQQVLGVNISCGARLRQLLLQQLLAIQRVPSDLLLGAANEDAISAGTPSSVTQGAELPSYG